MKTQRFFEAATTAILLLATFRCASEQETEMQSAEPKTQAPMPALVDAPPLTILSRAEWNAKDPISKMTPHEIKFITIHHTGVKRNPKKTLKEKMQGLQAFSQREDSLASGKTKSAWPDVPYHFYIADTGEVAEGREAGFVGDTNTEYDPTGHILVTLEGNFEEEVPTPAQLDSVRRLVTWLALKYHVPLGNIKGHKDYAQTACPGKNLHERISDIRDAVKKSQS